MDTTTKPETNIGIITRESDAQHAKKKQEGSSVQQKAAIYDYIKRLQATSPNEILKVVYVCEENRSASKNHHLRVQFEALKQLIRTGVIKKVIVYRLDRLARNEFLSQEFRQLLMDAKCELHEAVSGHIDFRKRVHRMKYSLDSMIAADFSDEHTEKITRNQRLTLVNSGKDTATLEILGLKKHKTKSCMYEHEPQECPPPLRATV
jgi:DNA invertase Pin-like site-specific DNA recombinase